MQSRHAYPSDVSDEEWALVAPYLTLLPETAAQREHSLREVFNGLRYVRRGCPAGGARGGARPGPLASAAQPRRGVAGGGLLRARRDPLCGAHAQR